MPTHQKTRHGKFGLIANARNLTLCLTGKLAMSFYVIQTCHVFYVNSPHLAAAAGHHHYPVIPPSGALWYICFYMKILAIAASTVPSNTANSIQVMKAVHALAQLGHDVTLLLPGKAPADVAALWAYYGIQTPFAIEWLPGRRIFKRYDFAFNALQRAKHYQPDLIYTWMMQAAWLGVRSKTPTLIELHDRITGRLAPWLFKRYLASPTPKRILTNTQALLQAVQADFGVQFPAGLAVVAPNGIEAERYRNLPDAVAARHQLGLPQGLMVGYTGHFYAGRGMDLLYRLAQANPQVNFLWVGGRADAVAQWQAKAQADGVKNLILTGFVENAKLGVYQAACDVLLMPYERKIAGSSGGNSADICSPMKMFEYMAAGRAIISSDLPVIHEVLNETNAVFCPPEDVDAWNAALQTLLADPARGERLGRQAAADVAQFTWRARAEKALAGLDAPERK